MADTRAGTGNQGTDLGAIRVLERLTPAEREALAAYLDPVETARGEAIIVESAPADRLVFVVQGELVVLRREVASGELHASDHAGIELLLGQKYNPASVQTRTVCTLLELRAPRLLALRQEQPALAFELAREAARRLVPELAIKVGPSVGFGMRLIVRELRGASFAQFAARLEFGWRAAHAAACRHAVVEPGCAADARQRGGSAQRPCPGPSPHPECHELGARRSSHARCPPNGCRRRSMLPRRDTMRDVACAPVVSLRRPGASLRRRRTIEVCA